MGNRYTKLVAEKPTTQKEPLPGREAEMAKNNAGGYSFALDMWKQLDRFLVLGSEGGTYYVNERDLTKQSVKVVDQCIAENPELVAVRVMDISVNGKAFKNDPAEFVTAKLIAAKGEARQWGWKAMPLVVRTGRTVLEFTQLLDALGVKWPMSRRTAFAKWYDERTADQVAYQVLKYPTSGKWSHLDLLRLAHPKQHAELYKYMVGKPSGAVLPDLVEGWERIKRAETLTEVLTCIRLYKLSWEFVPGKWQGDKDVWAELLPNLPLTALIRNLGRMTNYGLLNGINDSVKLVGLKLGNREYLRKARIHPMQALIAWRAYKGGGKNRLFQREDALTWEPNPKVSEALENAFYLSFDIIEPSGKNMFFGIDVSGSMSGQISGLPITCAQAATVLAMVSLRTEQNSIAYGFADGIRDLGLTKLDSFDAALTKASNVNWGGTDCSLPMMHALDNGMDFDQFVVLTDNETWAGHIHPTQALAKYREHTGINAKLVVVGMVATEFSIADPKDAGMLDVVGFDTSVPALISQFAQGM